MILRPATENDLARLLQELAGDSQISVQVDGWAIVVSATDVLHVESIRDRLLLENKIEADRDALTVIYLETICKTAEAEGKYIRQTGGLGNYGHVKIRLEPNDAGKGIEFFNEIKGGVVPWEYIDSVEMGVREAAQGGVLAGFEIVGVKASLFDGSYHEPDSNDMAFKIAGSMAFKEAARKANPILIEPFVAIEVAVNEAFLGATIADLNRRRARIVRIEGDRGLHTIHGIAPLSQMLLSRTQGRPHYSMRFSHYEQVLHPREPGDDGAGVTADLPRYPRAGSGSIARRLDEDVD